MEIAHLAVRFLDDSPAEPAGVAQPTSSPAPVEGVQVRDGFEDDRTRVLPVPKLSADVSGPIVIGERDRVAGCPVRDAGDVAISALEGTVRVALPRNAALERKILPRPRLGVQDLMATGWGWRVLGQGVLLAGIVFLMVSLPMLQLAEVGDRADRHRAAGAHAGGAAAGVAVRRADRGLADRADDCARAGAR